MNIRWNQVAIAAAAGLLCGALFSDFYHMHIKRRPPKPAPRPLETLFTRELKVSGPQWKRISAVLDEYQPEVEKVMEESRPKMDAIRARMQAELTPLLTPEQLATMRELEKELGPRGDRPPRRPPPR